MSLLIATGGHIPCRTPAKIATHGFIGSCGLIDLITPDGRTIWPTLDIRLYQPDRDYSINTNPDTRQALLIRDSLISVTTDGRVTFKTTSTNIAINDDNRTTTPTRRKTIN